MISLIKRDVLISKAPIITAFFLIPLAYFVTLPPVFTTVGLLLPVIVIGLFYLDDRAHMNRFTKSLPISQTRIVQSRYMSLFLLWLLFVLYQTVVGHLLGMYSETPRYVYQFKDILTVLCLGLLLTSILVPLYYLFTSFAVASTIMLILYTGIVFSSFFPLAAVLGMEDYISFNDIDQGFVPLIETYIPFQPFIVLAVISVVLYMMSWKISENFFIRKDA